ncbi:Hypothetical protein phosphatase, partial [Stegodyphus mimosarum]
MNLNVVYTPIPKTNVDSAAGTWDDIYFGAASMQGWRHEQSDTYTCFKDFFENFKFFAVYDGHGGSEIAIYLQRNLHEFILHHMKKTEDVELSLQFGFLECDSFIKEPEGIQALNSILDELTSQNLLSAAERFFRFRKLPPLEADSLPERAANFLSDLLAQIRAERESRSAEQTEQEKEEKMEVESAMEEEEEQSEMEEEEEDMDEEILLDDEEEEKNNTVKEKEEKKSVIKKEKSVKENKETCVEEKKKETCVEEKKEATCSGNNFGEKTYFCDDCKYFFCRCEEIRREESESPSPKRRKTEEDDDKNVIDLNQIMPGVHSGSTATVVLLNKSTLYLANVGDSRCVLSTAGRAIDLSVDHRPSVKEEAERIISAGGTIKDGRINESLNLSR